MRKLLVGSLLCLWTGMSGATEIEGKWGLGVSAGDLIGSRAEISLIRGKSPATAWVLDLNIVQAIEDADAILTATFPTFLAGGYVERTEFLSVRAGPRLRRYTRPDARFSPYWDLYLWAVWDSRRLQGRGFSDDRIRAGGELGSAFGVEYFLPQWHSALAAHTGLLFVQLLRVGSHRGETVLGSGEMVVVDSKGTSQAAGAAISPRLQLRVYF